MRFVRSGIFSKQMMDLQAGMDFLNKLAVIAEEESHHPDVSLTGYQNVTITLSTFSIGGLHDNDFILGEFSLCERALRFAPCG